MVRERDGGRRRARRRPFFKNTVTHTTTPSRPEKNQTGVDEAFSDLITRVIRRQLELEASESSGGGGGADSKKKKKKIKAPRIIKGFYKGGKKVVKGEKCSVS